MTDKPKRKRTPNRRRKFLLRIVLPIVVLMAGVVALSSQINVWLATDPFTPQCHFEEDRLFATGHPLRLTSINQGQFESIDDAGLIRQISWSPDGTMLTARDPNSIEDNEAVLMSADSEVLHIFEENINSIPSWSDDSQSIEFSGDVSNYRINIKTWETESWIVPMSGFHIGYSNKSKSPNGRYAPYGVHRNGGFVSWYIKDIQESKEWSLSPNGGYVSDSSFIGWSDNSRFIYLSIGQMLMQYDVESHQLTNLLELPYVPAVERLSPDSTKVILYDFENSAVFIDLNTLELITFGNKISDHKLGWISDNRYWIYGEKRNYDVYDSIHVYDTIENTSRKLHIPAGIDLYKIGLSPSGRYLQYQSVIATENNSSTYVIYDLETDVEHTIGAYLFEHRIKWFSHEGKDYLLIQKQVSADQSQPYLTTLMNAENFESCKIGYTAWTLAFQP